MNIIQNTYHSGNSFTWGWAIKLYIEFWERRYTLSYNLLLEFIFHFVCCNNQIETKVSIKFWTKFRVDVLLLLGRKKEKGIDKLECQQIDIQ